HVPARRQQSAHVMSFRPLSSLATLFFLSQSAPRYEEEFVMHHRTTLTKLRAAYALDRAAASQPTIGALAKETTMQSTNNTSAKNELVELSANEMLAIDGGWFAAFFGKVQAMVAELTKNPIVIPADTKLYIPQ